MNTDTEKPEIIQTMDQFPDETPDPFDKTLDDRSSTEEERLDLNDTNFAATRKTIPLEGMNFAFLKPPYMNFEDHINAKQKLVEAFEQDELLLLYGYSGCGKTTILTQFAEKHPHCVFLTKDFDSLSPSQLLAKMGDFVNLPIKQRTYEISTLEDHLATLPKVMYLFDEVTADNKASIQKLEMLRKIYDAVHIPIVICGTPHLYNCIYASNNFKHFSSLIVRMDEHELHGMRSEDAGNYLQKISETENLQFTYKAQQALIRTALNKNIGGIHAFTTIIGRCITLARVNYYHEPGHSMPEINSCVRYDAPDGEPSPGAKIILTPPVTPDTLQIPETMVLQLMGEYKSHFPIIPSKQ